MKLPNFVIIGAAKAGTTALWEYLLQHPQVFGSWIKEPAYFAYPGGRPNFAGPGDLDFKVVTSWSDYQALFNEADGYAAVGEASTQYIYDASAPKRIHDVLPQVRIVAMLRHPAERAYAHYNHWVRRGVETEAEFSRALEREPERMKQNFVHWWYYKDQGFYYRQLRPYFDVFGSSRIRVFLQEDLRSSDGMFRELFEFLEIDSSFKPDTSKRHNQGAVPRSAWLNRTLLRPNLIRSLAKRLVPQRIRRSVTPLLMKNNMERPAKLEPGIRAALVGEYREDILRLEGLIGRDLSLWLKD